MVPATPVQLLLAIWILIPFNQGEKAMYVIMSSYLEMFETKMTSTRDYFFETLLFCILTVARSTSNYCSTRISSSYLSKMRQITEEMDEVLSY